MYGKEYQKLVANIVGIRPDMVGKHHRLFVNVFGKKNMDSPNLGIPMPVAWETVANALGVSNGQAKRIVQNLIKHNLLAKTRRDMITPDRPDHLADEISNLAFVVWVTPLADLLFHDGAKDEFSFETFRHVQERIDDYIRWCECYPEDAEWETWFWWREYDGLFGTVVPDNHPLSPLKNIHPFGFATWQEFIDRCEAEGITPCEKPDDWIDWVRTPGGWEPDATN